MVTRRQEDAVVAATDEGVCMKSESAPWLLGTRKNNMTRPTNVYIVNKGMHDYSGASRFGILVPLTTGIQQTHSLTHMIREIEDTIANSSPLDWLLVSGPTTLNCIACVLFVRLHGRLNLLIYTSRQERYLSRTIVFEEKVC